MSDLEPPRRADRLLTRLLPPSREETIIGDLHEQYRRGRSRAWYWGQAIEAVARSLMRDLQNHKLLTFRALACGWLILAVCDYFVLRPLWRLDRWLFMVGLSSHYVAWEGTVLTALIQNVLVALVGAGTGWIVGRTHRGCAVPIAFAFAVSVGAYLAVPFGWLVHALVVFPHRQFGLWPGVLLITVVAPSSVLLGALLSTRSRVKASS